MTKKEKERDRQNLDAFHEINEERIRYRTQNESLVASNQRLQRELDETKQALLKARGIEWRRSPQPNLNAAICIGRETLRRLSRLEQVDIGSQGVSVLPASDFPCMALQDHELIESLQRFWNLDHIAVRDVRQVIGRIVNV